ncbi:DUF2752 domain-containing protein [Streptomyces sp. NPDC059853]|uniref:DUF2752 domain-containing protein n=1 Tax=Streptomyces sp. NPDC059853 TaxID=3346973 RepID=UPI003656D73F
MPPPAPAARRLRRAAAPLAALATAGAAWAVVATVDPGAPDAPYPACPLPALTGWDCPGCGGLRAAHALAHGLPGQALAANALVVVAALALGTALLAWLVAELRGRPVRPPAVPAACRWALAAAVAAFTVLRNLPLFPPGA